LQRKSWRLSVSPIEPGNASAKTFPEICGKKQYRDFGGSDVLSRPLRATFERRGTELNAEQYSSLLRELDSDPKKHLQWRALINKGQVAGAPEFSAAIQIIDRFKRSPLTAARSRNRNSRAMETRGRMGRKQ
jgi:hypothetical protein